MNAAGQSFDPHPTVGGRLGTPARTPKRHARSRGIDDARNSPSAEHTPRTGTMTAARGLVPPRSARGGAVHLPARRARGYRIPRALPAILAVAAALVPATAAAAPAPIPAGSLPTRAERFVERTLQVPIPHRPFIGVAGELPCAGTLYAGGRPMLCDALAYPDRIEVRRAILVQLRGVERHRLDLGAVELMLHEILHRPASEQAVAEALATGELAIAPGLEEGRVQALALDLLPAFCRSQRITCGQVSRVAPYAVEVNAVRAWSVRVTQGSPWRSRAARLARRQLWAAAPADAQRMYDDAWRQVEHEGRP